MKVSKDWTDAPPDALADMLDEAHEAAEQFAPRRYAGMTGEEFVDYLLDDGLVKFVDQQWRALSGGADPWHEITMRVWYLSHKTWQPTPSYLQSLYVEQGGLTAEVQAA